MARPKSETPSYCHHKRSDRAYVTIDGQQRTLPGPHGSEESRAAYDRLIAEWLNNGRRLPAAVAGTARTVSMIALEFWRHSQTYYKKADGTPTSEVENIRQTLRVLKKLYGDTPAVEFGPKKLKALRSHMLATKDEKDATTGKMVTRPGWCRTYTNRQIKRVQLLFRWAASEELIPASVSAALGTVAGVRRGSEGARESDPVGPVADDVVNATLPFLPPPVKAMVQLQRLAGARGGELFGLRTCDIERAAAGQVWKYRPVQHKTAHHGKARVIRFGPQAQEILRPFLRPDLSAFIFQPGDAVAWKLQRQREKRGDRPQTPSQRARAERAKGRRCKARYGKDSYARAVARACDVAFPLPTELARQKVPAVKSNGRKFQRWETKGEWKARLAEKWPAVQRWRDEHRWHPHQLRHSSATAYRRDADFESAKIVLGHTSDAMTALYAERDERKADEAVARLG